MQPKVFTRNGVVSPAAAQERVKAQSFLSGALDSYDFMSFAEHHLPESGRVTARVLRILKFHPKLRSFNAASEIR